MRSCFRYCAFVLFVAVCTVSRPATAQDATASSESTDSTSKGSPTVLFNGKDLSNWMGRPDLWSIENNEIVGRTSDEAPISGNTFLIYKGDVPENFELVAQFKIESGNSGIQYRSRVVDEDAYVVSGYQADIDFGNKFAGILYEEKARGILALRGKTVTIDADGEKSEETFGDAVKIGNGIHPGQWNEFRVVADGNHLTHYINGAKTAEVIDQQTEAAAKSGVIALQLHRGPAMTVRFKNVQLLPIED